GAPPNIDGTPAGGAALAPRLAPRLPDDFFAADRPVFAALGAARLAGAFLAAFFAVRFFAPAFFFAVLPAAFFVVFVVFFAPDFFLAAI
ncbi:hypothetical protein G6O45_23840, partial [Salmonella enterica subsp. enterica serovar Istanbul]|nr:hypothetical protein [Salmonella enterica subsp. enterica serovar Istanbul]